MRQSVGCMRFEILPNLLLIVGLKYNNHLFINLLGCLFLVIVDVATNEQVNHKCNHYIHCHNTTIVEHSCNKCCNYKRGSGSNEPATYYRHHTGNAVHSTLTSPGTVGKRRTHTHHKGNISSREWQLERRTQSDEQTGKHKVHRRTHEVKGNIFAFFERSKTCTNPRFYVLWSLARNSIDKFGYRTHHITRYRRSTEHFALFVLLARKVYRCLQHLACLLACIESIHHYRTCTNKEERRSLIRKFFRTSWHKRCHREGIYRVTDTVGNNVLERLEASQCNTNEVHKVVTRKCHSKRECTHKNDNFQHIDLAPVQQLHNQSQYHEGTKKKENCIIKDEVLYGIGQFSLQDTSLKTLYDHKIDNGCRSKTAIEAYFTAKMLAIVEGEYYTGYPLHKQTEEKGNGHRKEYRDNDCQCTAGIKMFESCATVGYQSCYK